MDTGLSEIEAQHFLELAQRLLSNDNDVRGQAEQAFQGLKENSPEKAMLSLLHILTFSNDIPARIMCAVLLRQEVMVPCDDEGHTWLWLSLAPEVLGIPHSLLE
jgi:hypothetical protein